MIYVPIKYVRPGMVLAKDVVSPASFFSLLVTGQQLSDVTIKRLHQYEIDGVYIQSSFGDDVVVEEFIDPKVKRQAVKDLKELYEGYVKQGAISDMALEKTKKLAEELVMYILSKDQYLVNIIDIKDYDTYTYSHSMFVSILSVLIGTQLGYNKQQLSELALCGLMHDIGKLDIPLEIINKTTALTDEEFALIRQHPQKSIDRLRPCRSMPQRVLNGIACHHEKYDGTGYPRGLDGENIPIYGRILALADVFDALTSQRSYRKAWAPCDTLEYMVAQSGTHFDDVLLSAFLHTVAAYPVGTLVRLSTGDIALVVCNHQQNTLRPTVRLVRGGLLGKRGTEVNLLLDGDYLNVTVTASLISESGADEGIYYPQISPARTTAKHPPH
ncbi:MAG: HD-GYP domain-containing protein [Oscillospiraceae bacterium]|nr:HD-GYP domain-containing protein [Oscillospiraceae bacterium]